MNPATFWRRYAAWSLDAVLILLPIVLLFRSLLRDALSTMDADYATFLRQAGRSLVQVYADGGQPSDLAGSWIGSAAMMASLGALQAAIAALAWPLLLAFAVLGALYHVGFETSARQATPGQRALGVRVLAASGMRVDPQRALLRYLAGGLSWITLNLGHAMALLPDRLTLHDRVSGTRVVQARRAMPLPGWAKAWLGLQLLATLWFTIAFVRLTDAGLQKGLDALN